MAKIKAVNPKFDSFRNNQLILRRVCLIMFDLLLGRDGG